MIQHSDSEEQRYSVYTLAAQAGLPAADEHLTPAVPPIVPSVGYLHPTMADVEQALAYDGAVEGKAEHFVYARHGGANQADFERAIARLEGAEGAISFSSGMAALHAAILTLVPPGGRVLAAETLYGVTHALFDWLHAAMNLEVRRVDFLDLEAVRQAAAEMKPHALFCEVLTNPLMRVVRLQQIAQIAQESGAHLIVDNTFATPFLLQPLRLGATLVVHSATKYLNGHGDVTGGVIAGADDLMRRAFGYRKLLGAAWGAFDAWLALRGLRTFALRMAHTCESALQVARWLAQRRGVGHVYYPGLPADPAHWAARELFENRGYGGMIAFEIEGLAREGAFSFVEHLKLIKPVTSLGDLYSLILHPATSSHRALTPEQREAQGITEGVLRLSVGIESPDDLIEDLDQALRAVSR
ncbi:MAG: O-succinylhomoserine sulfhydrylase [Anaerolineae bacterium]